MRNQSKKMTKFGYFFTSESVGEGHPDKVADQLSDTLLDNFLAYDPKSRVACEAMVTTGQVIVAGEVTSETYIDIRDVVREKVKSIGYDKQGLGFDGDSCGVLCAIHEQSPDIARGVDNEEQGAGDIGIMFGYAVNETDTYMPLTHYLSSKFVMTIDEIRHEGLYMRYLRPDSKAQVTVEYDEETNNPIAIDSIVLCLQHDDSFDDEEEMRNRILDDVMCLVIPRMLCSISTESVMTMLAAIKRERIFVNPTGWFEIGGPTGDTGLTGRKVIVDTYGGRGAHGGGAFSGKDPSKVDRSAAYMARFVAKNMVAAGISDEVLVQVSYAIGKAEPMSLYVNTYGKSKVNYSDSEIAKIISTLYDFRPSSIIKSLLLLQPMYAETSTYGHFGRESRTVKKSFHNKYEGDKDINVILFTWERLTDVSALRASFGLET